MTDFSNLKAIFSVKQKDFPKTVADLANHIIPEAKKFKVILLHNKILFDLNYRNRRDQYKSDSQSYLLIFREDSITINISDENNVTKNTIYVYKTETFNDNFVRLNESVRKRAADCICIQSNPQTLIYVEPVKA